MEDVMNIIAYAGTAKSLALEAIKLAREGNIEEAREELNKANDNSLLAHKGHQNLLAKDASGDKVDIDVLFVHAQDHLMGAINMITVAEEMINLYERLQELEVD